MVAPTSTGLRSSCRSRSGAFTRCSTRTNATTAAADRAKHPIVANDAQPQVEPFVSAKITGARITAISTVPAKSIERVRAGSLDSFTEASVRGMQAAAIAASIQNRPCHPVVEASTPPTSGPTAAPIAEAAPHSVTARNWAVFVWAAAIRLIPQARIVAPEAPWMQRPAMTIRPSCASAIITHEAMNSASPMRNSRRRPNTSPSAPEVTIVAAPISEYPVTAHCRVSTDIPVSAEIAGSRMVTADVFALTTSVEMQVTSSTPTARRALPSFAVGVLMPRPGDSAGGSAPRSSARSQPGPPTRRPRGCSPSRCPPPPRG